MKFAIYFIVFSSIFAQDGFNEFFKNFQQENQQQKSQDRSLISKKSSKNFINDKLPDGFKFIIDENNIDHYVNIQKQFHQKLTFSSEYSSGFQLLFETSLELDDKIKSYFQSEQKKMHLKKLLPNEKDKDIFESNFTVIRKEFKMCLLKIRSNLFNEQSIVNCVGKDLSKVNNALSYQFRQYQARKESSLRQIFLSYCYEQEGAEPTDCDLIEKDMIDLLWENYSLADNFRENRIKYEGLSGHVSQEIYEHLLSIFVQFSEKNEEMTLFMKEIYEGLKLKLKEDIDKRQRLILEFEVPQKIEQPSVYINTKVDIKETFQGDDNQVSIDNLPSLRMNKDPRLFNNHDSIALQDLKSKYPNYDERHYPFNGLKGPRVTIPE